MHATAFEDGTQGWNVVNEGALTTGTWQLAVPVGTTNGTYASAPAADASSAGTRAWVTQNGSPGGTASTADVDGGTTRLVSPSFDLSAAASATVSYSAWYFCSDAPPAGSNPGEVDPLVVEASADDGATWAVIDTVSSYPVPNAWTRRSVALPALSSAVRIREHTCVGDTNADGYVDGSDLGSLLGQWGTQGSCDFNGDGLVDGNDLGMMLAAWGPCP
jgi:hypothetical protein